MAGNAAAMAAILKALQLVLVSLQAYLGWGNYLCPLSTPIDTILSHGPYQVIVIGSGEAGSVISYRLSETDQSVLVIEAGGCAPLESLMSGLFTTLPRSSYDYAYDAYNDGYACQNQQPDGAITMGKMLGGSGSINHVIYVSGNKNDYNSWGEAAHDPSWAFPAFAQYFAKGENVQHQGVLDQNTYSHRTDGPTILTKQESLTTAPLIEAYGIMGIPYKNDTDGQCVVEPLLAIGNNLRQCGNVAYASKTIGKPNVEFLLNAVVTRIIFEGNTATGVEFTYDGKTYTVGATKQVVVSAGAIKSPQLLTVSGIGDRETLERIGVPLVAENKHVGQNLMDHPGSVLIFALDENTGSIPASNYADFPVPMVTSYVSLDTKDKYTERQDIALLFPPDSAGFLQLCTLAFKYNDNICDAWYEYNKNRTILFVVMNLMKPVSRGSVNTVSKNINDQPITKLNILSNKEDLELLAKHAFSLSKIVDTEPMKKLNAEFADVGVCQEYEKDTLDYWRCYVLEMSSTMWHYSGTCALGSVVDSYLNVIGVNKVKVVDASIFSSMVSGNIGSTVRAVAEKAADIIKKDIGAETCA